MHGETLKFTNKEYSQLFLPSLISMGSS